MPAGTAQGPTKATVASRTVDPNVAGLGKSHLILKCAYNYPQTLIPGYVLIFFVKACLPPFPQKMRLMPFSKIVQSYYHIHSKKLRDFSGKPDEKNPHSPFSLLKWNSFLCHIVSQNVSTGKSLRNIILTRLTWNVKSFSTYWIHYVTYQNNICTTRRQCFSQRDTCCWLWRLSCSTCEAEIYFLSRS